MKYNRILICCCVLCLSFLDILAQSEWTLNDRDYFVKPGLNLMAFQDVYPDGHQGGVTLVQNGERVLANGDLRLEAMPGQWAPIPKRGPIKIDRDPQSITTTLWYPDSTKNRVGFNPIIYPELTFAYDVRVYTSGDTVVVSVDLHETLPEEWYGKVGFNIELFPQFYFGKRYYMDDQSGIFPRQVNARFQDEEVEPMATGSQLQIVPENIQETITFNSPTSILELYDGRAPHNNGWFILRALVKKGALDDAVVLKIIPEANPDYVYPTILQVSQVGYQSRAPKQAVFERDPIDKKHIQVFLERFNPQGGHELVKSGLAVTWGEFLRYRYEIFDFTEVEMPGIYRIRYLDQISHPFEIGPKVYQQDVWQPTLAYYLPVQMCHMRINDRYKVWHGLCHNDDAQMAPINHNHFDGYVQGNQTFTRFQSGDRVPGINVGGWHDAGDYDLRIESQANTVLRLAEMHQLFNPGYDGTSINQSSKVVEMLVPDGIDDIKQQIEHGVLTVVAGYQSLGRLYRGIICRDLRQYTLLGDASVMTDNLDYEPSNSDLINDDRWVFTEDNPARELQAAACMAIASISLKGHNDTLAQNAMKLALDYWDRHRRSDHIRTIQLAAALWQATGDEEYRMFLYEHAPLIAAEISTTAIWIARIAKSLEDASFWSTVRPALQNYASTVKDKIRLTPYGVEYKPNIWGAGWGIQAFGYQQYWLHRAFPDLFDVKPIFNALHFVLGVHPGSNTASFVSGVGSKSLTVAYGVNRDEWSYIPGGSASGTALIRPDLPELKTWPYFWQQTEYVMGGGATNFMFLVLATEDLLKD